MNLVSIPFCFLPNSRVQVIDLDSPLRFRSKFQYERLVEISNRPDFAYFVILQTDGSEWVIWDGDSSAYCPVHVFWYDRNGQFWAGHIGVKRMLTDWHKVGDPSAPAPFDGVVYQTRCQ